jgi:hypothetical protein
MSGSLDSSEGFGFEGGSYSKSYGRPASTRRPPSVGLVPLPTDITVSPSASTGHDSRNEASKWERLSRQSRSVSLSAWGLCLCESLA